MYVSFHELSPLSRVWVYAAQRPLAPDEQQQIQQQAAAFTQSWTAHQQDLKASFTIVHDLFLVLAVDESHHGASGCSIDKSVAFIKQIEQSTGLHLFNRMQIEIQDETGVRIVSKAEALQLAGNPQVRYFDKTITTLQQLHHEFAKPIQQAWFYTPQTA